jgi:hypothetical protein
MPDPTADPHENTMRNLDIAIEAFHNLADASLEHERTLRRRASSPSPYADVVYGRGGHP